MTDALSILNLRKNAVLVATAFVLAAVAVLAMLANTDAAETVLVRGIVKPGGSTDTVNVYITHVETAADASKIRGIRTDVNVSKAKKYKWINSGGTLTKVRTTANAVPQQEVVVRGTLLDDNRITASWIVANYREFVVEGKLQASTRDTGFTDQGWVTVDVTSSKLRGIAPARAFKEAALLDKDLRIRVNGSTAITSLGKSKRFDEVVAKQQKVRVEGQVLDEDTWVSSKFNEINE